MLEAGGDVLNSLLAILSLTKWDMVRLPQISRAGSCPGYVFFTRSNVTVPGWSEDPHTLDPVWTHSFTGCVALGRHLRFSKLQFSNL